MQTFTGLQVLWLLQRSLTPAGACPSGAGGASCRGAALAPPGAAGPCLSVCALTSSRLFHLFIFLLLYLFFIIILLSSHSYSHPFSHRASLRSVPPRQPFLGGPGQRVCGGARGGQGLLTLHLQDLVAEVGLDVVGAVGRQDQPQAAEGKADGRREAQHSPGAVPCGHPLTPRGTQGHPCGTHGCPGVPEDVLGCPRTSWGTQGYPGAPRDIMEHPGPPWGTQENPRAPGDILEHPATSWSTQGYPGAPRTTRGHLELPKTIPGAPTDILELPVPS